MDDLTKEQRHKNMTRIRSKDTRPETIVAHYLFAQGFRYRRNDKRYPGKPDIILPKYRTAIYVNGCFWHQHEGCRYAVIPQTRQDYWVPKLRRNVERDRENCKALRSMGWHVIVVWECEIRRKSERDARLASLAEEIRRRDG